MAVPQVAKLVALQHNCARGGQVLEAVLETAVRRGADVVLIQEPKGAKEKDSTHSHPSFNFMRGEEAVPAKCWIAVNRASKCQVTELKNLASGTANHVQVVEVTPPSGEAIIIANVYDRHAGSKNNRPAQRAAWGEIAWHKRVIVAGDINACSKMWNPRTTRPRNNAFWVQLIQERELVIWNSEEETRMGAGAGIHSIIDLTLSSPEVVLNWSMAPATGSDHELLHWEVLGAASLGDATSTAMTGWDISRWDLKGKKDKEEANAAAAKRAQAQECYRRGVGASAVLADDSTLEEVYTAVVILREAMVGTLDQHARSKRWCSRSKRWWNPALKALRKALGRAQRGWRTKGMSQVQEARGELRRAIRKVKRDCWNHFLQESSGKEVWTAASYTKLRIDKAGQALQREDGSVAEGHSDREQAILEAHFPPAPGGSYEPPADGRAFVQVDAHLVGSLLAKAANTSAPGDDQISPDIVKVFWQRDTQRFVQLVRACIRLGLHPTLWKTARVW